jgi:uncharacterized protein (TIRG00374 family)
VHNADFTDIRFLRMKGKVVRNNKVFRLILRIFLTYGISIFLLIYLFNKVDTAAIGRTIKDVPAVNYLLAVLLYFVSQALSALKWSILVRNAPFPLMLRWTFISQFFASVIPGQVGGDVIKVYGLKKYGISLGNSAASVIIDRIIGLAALMVLINAAMWRSEYGSTIPFIRTVALVIMCGIFVFGLIQIVMVKKFEVPLETVKRGLVSLVIRFMTSLRQSGSSLPRVSTSFLLSLFFQLLSIVKIYAVAKALIPSVSFTDWCWIGGIVSVAMLFPVSVGGLGIREGGYVVLLAILSVSVENAVALSLTMYSIQLIGALSGFGLYAFGLFDTRGKATESHVRNADAIDFQ